MKAHNIIKDLLKKTLLKTGLFRVLSIPRPYKVIKYPAVCNEKKFRVLHCIELLEIGGSQRLVIDLVEHLDSIYAHEIITDCIKYPLAYVGVKIAQLSTYDKIRSYIKSFKPDIVHIHCWQSDWYRIVLRIAEELNLTVIENINVPTDPYISKVVHSYVYVSNFVKNKYSRGLNNEIVIYPGSNFSMFSSRNIDTSPDNCIGMVYRLFEGKLNQDSIDVFIKVAQRKKDVRCLIVGGGSLYKVYKNKVKKAGLLENFIFTGFVGYKQLPSLYKKMSIFVAPVCSESFGQVSPFAMSIGMPVCAYNVGALEEIICDKSLLAQPENSDSLADIVVDLLNDRPRRLKIAKFNQERATALFSIQAMIKSYKILYTKALSDSMCFSATID